MTYALVFALSLAGCKARASAIEPIDHKPVATLAAALKAAGHKRIAQGMDIIVAKDKGSGELFSARSPIFVTTKTGTDEWTLSVAHDKEVGSILLTGIGFQRLQDAKPGTLPSFEKAKAQPVIAKLGARATYYPDEIARVAAMGYKRLFTGKVSTVGVPDLKSAMKPAFFDLLTKDDGSFVALLIDETGACKNMAAGEEFGEAD